MGNIHVILDPETRQAYLSRLLELDGLTEIHENPKGAYTSISLTSTPDELKPVLKQRQEQLKNVLRQSGIDIYNPGDSSTYNPDMNTEAGFAEVYAFDTVKVVSNRFFTGHLLVPSTGQGNEAEKARIYNRFSVMFIDQGNRVSRMQPFRSIYLAYTDFAAQADDFQQVFEMMVAYEPGMGFHNNVPVLLGFKNGKVIDLEEAVYSEFPNLQFRYDGNTPLLKLRAENPELFYEMRS